MTSLREAKVNRSHRFHGLLQIKNVGPTDFTDCHKINRCKLVLSVGGEK